MAKPTLIVVQNPASSDLGLAIPDDDLAADFEFEANESYHDLRPLDWSDVAIALDRDRMALAKHLAGELIEDNVVCEREVADRSYEITDDDLFLELFRARDALDAGVSSAVTALAATGCTPFTSCNGGAFGGHHSSPYPVVRFFAPAHVFPDIDACANSAGVELEIDLLGRVEVRTHKVEMMVAFAEAIIERLRPPEAH